MSVRKKRRQSLNTKYDRLLKPGHSPRSDTSSLQLRPSLIPTQSQIEANHKRLVKDRSRNRDRLWLDLGMKQEQFQAPCFDSVELPTFVNFDAEGGAPEIAVTASQHEIESRNPEPYDQRRHCHLPHSYLDPHEDEWPFMTDSQPIPVENRPTDQAVSHNVPTFPTPSPIQLLWTPQGVISCSGAPVQWFYAPDMCVPLPSDAVLLTHTTSSPSDQTGAATSGLHAFDTGRMEMSEIKSDLGSFNENEYPLYDSASHLSATLAPEPPPVRVSGDVLPDSQGSLSTIEDQVHWEPPFSIDDLDATDSASETNEQVDPGSRAEVDNAVTAYRNSSPAPIPETAAPSADDPIEERSVAQRAESESPDCHQGQITSVTVPDPYLRDSAQKPRRVQVKHASISNRTGVGPILCAGPRPCSEPMLNRKVDRRQYLAADSKHSLKSRLTTDEPRARPLPTAPRSRGTKHTTSSKAPAPHTPISAFGERPQPLNLHTVDRHSLDSVEHFHRSLSQSSDFKSPLPSTRNASIQTIPEIPTQNSNCTEAKNEEQWLGKSSGDTEEATTMAAEVLLNASGLELHPVNGSGGRITPTLPPGCTTAPYHKPGLHTLSQTIFKRRPEAWANLTYQQQPGTNSLDPKTPAPPTPTIAPVDVWLSVGETSEVDKRLESIGEVPELEEIEVDAASGPDEKEQQGETEDSESIRSFTPSQEQPRKRKKKKQVRFNLDHEEFLYESEPDPRRIIGLLRHHPPGQSHGIGHETAVHEFGGGTRRELPGADVKPKRSLEANKQEPSSETNQQEELKTQEEEEKPGASPDPQTDGDSKSDIGFTIYRDGY